jgi:hypothetical protein
LNHHPWLVIMFFSWLKKITFIIIIIPQIDFHSDPYLQNFLSWHRTFCLCIPFNKWLHCQTLTLSLRTVSSDVYTCSLSL